MAGWASDMTSLHVLARNEFHCFHTTHFHQPLILPLRKQVYTVTFAKLLFGTAYVHTYIWPVASTLTTVSIVLLT